MHQLKEKVIKPALADIHEHTDLVVRFGQVKSGREIIAFQFSITKKQSPRGMTVQDFVNANPGLTHGKTTAEVKTMISKHYDSKQYEPSDAERGYE
jgi:plasmid replication initiation protein